jgi:hypothetical protein
VPEGVDVVNHPEAFRVVVDDVGANLPPNLMSGSGAMPARISSVKDSIGRGLNPGVVFAVMQQPRPPSMNGGASVKVPSAALAGAFGSTMRRP